MQTSIDLGKMNKLKRLSTSLTKGCIAHKPLKCRKVKCIKSSRYKYAEKEFLHLWNKIEAEILDIENACYHSTFDAILNFIHSCIKFPLQQMDEIPAAVIQLGVNIPDHHKIFRNLEKHLQANKNFTVILESSKCNNFSSTVRIIYNELQSQSNNITSSPRKSARAYKETKLKPIILMMQDVETFNGNLLQEIILNCKIYLCKLPIILLFGMSSTMVTMHKILSQKALCHLGIETFHSVAANECLTRIIEEVVMSPLQPFNLGPKVFRLIVDTVLYHDFSVTNLCQLLRFSLIEHFLTNKGAILCCFESELEERVMNLRSDELNILKTLPSLELHKDNNPDVISSLSSPTSFKILLIELLKNLYKFQKIFLISLRILHYLTKDLPGQPLGKHLREIYSLSLEKQIYLTSGFKEAASLLKMQSQNELLFKLKSCASLIQSDHHNIPKELKTVIKNSIEKLTNLSSNDFEKNQEKPFKLGDEKIMSRFQLQEKIRSSIKLKRSRFDAVRCEIVDNVFEYFKDIVPPSMMPLHEIFYFNDIHTLKKHLIPAPRITLCSALANPHQYFQCKCCRISASEIILPSMPDMCMLYKLHLECGKLINLCDWLEAFKVLKHGQEAKQTRVSKLKVDDSEINIRFLHTASELQLLGFIKPTKRKTDHVAKLTFGTF